MAFDLRQEKNRCFIERADGEKLYFDAVTRRSESNSAKVSSHPVETGFVIADHVSIENIKLLLEGVISNANNSLLNRSLDVISDQESAREFLKEIFNSKKKLTLVTPESEYQDLIMTSLTFNKDKPSRQVLEFSLKLEQIRTVVSRTALVPAETVDEDVKNAIQNESKGGTANTSTAAAEDLSPLQKAALAIRKIAGDPSALAQ